MNIKSLLVFLILLNVFECKDLVVGYANNKHIFHREGLEYEAIPLFRRDKQYFYADPYHRTIQAIIAKDQLHSAAEPRITAGGVGSEYVNLEFVSERGEGLSYDVTIYGY